MAFFIAFDIPGEPVGKGRPRFTTANGHPRTYTPEKTVDFENRVRAIATGKMHGCKPVDGPLFVEILADFAIPKSFSRKDKANANLGGLLPIKKPDVDNIAKAVCDALNGVVYLDDKQIVEIKVRKRYGLEPCIMVRVLETCIPAM
jgi:Holliday junction resolvase RusA-like endonuclease